MAGFVSGILYLLLSSLKQVKYQKLKVKMIKNVKQFDIWACTSHNDTLFVLKVVQSDLTCQIDCFSTFATIDRQRFLNTTQEYC